MSRVVKAKAKLGVSIEQEAGQYSVISEGKIVYSTRVLSAAEVKYEELVDELTATSREQRARESSHYNMQAVRSDSFERRAAKSRKRGGRGGRGGV